MRRDWRQLATGAAGAALAMACVAPGLAAQDRERDRDRGGPDFTWDGAMQAGRTLYVRNLNGAIRVTKADGERASVAATKRWRRGDPAEVRIEQVKALNGGDVIICAFWGDRSTCDEEGYRTHNDRDGWSWRGNRNDVSVEFTVKLPAGVKVVVTSVNGEVSVEDATSEVEAASVNGSVWAASSGGPVVAHSVNGDVRARMSQRGTRDLRFSSVNGTVIVQVPDNIDADLSMSTVNGSVQSDFPVTISGKLNPRRLNATLGKGGPRIELRTVNGDVRLRKVGGER
ncbi:MAG: hypothetical protein HYX65_03300 [Gemmatimonadetes bacterium]|nr:hypothetical protein [Gemmatimonadota bacterium]